MGVTPSRDFYPLWLLHLGVFVVAPAAMIAAGWIASSSPEAEREKAITRFAPVWLQGLVGILLAYAFCNFFYVAYLNEWGGPGRIDGELVLHSHGRIIRKLTRDEYDRHQAYVDRSFSGGWMFFYVWALMILVAWEKAERASSHSRDRLGQEG